MTGREIELSKALTLYLKNYPGKNDSEFDAFYGAQQAADAKAAVHAILREAMSLRPDWSQTSLNEGGDFVEAEMHARYPGLSAKALESIGNYYTYLKR